MSKQSLFVSYRFWEPQFVIRSGESKQVVEKGETHTIVTRPKRVTFRKMPYNGSYRGELFTEDAEVIDFLRNHEYFKNGLIEEVVAVPSQAERIPPDMVSQGAVDSGKREPTVDTVAPADVPKSPSKAKVGVGRPRKAVTA